MGDTIEIIGIGLGTILIQHSSNDGGPDEISGTEYTAVLAGNNDFGSASIAVTVQRRWGTSWVASIAPVMGKPMLAAVVAQAATEEGDGLKVVVHGATRIIREQYSEGEAMA